MDITPLLPEGRQVIQAYGDGGFRIAGTRHGGAVLILPGQTVPWPVDGLAGLAAGDFAPVVRARPAVEILLIGCGSRVAPLAPALREALRAEGIVVEAMDTGAACRTWNVLLAEERQVAAALLPV